MPGTDLMPRVTLDALLGHRERALDLAKQARALYRQQQDALNALYREIHSAVSGATSNQASLYKLGDYVTDNHDDDEAFAANIRRDLDKAIWPSILTITGLGGLMDKQARDEFERDLASDPPECTVENITSTFRQLKDDAHRIFRRGLVNVFRNLSREYRSHDGFKLGPRTIISWGVQRYSSRYETLADADRIMCILDGQRIEAGWTSEVASRLYSEVKWKWSGSDDWPVPGELSTPFWRVKWFKNRNVHLWCLRSDLLRRANRLIAEHFEDALGEGPDAAGARKYHRPKPHHHTVVDFYPTSDAVAQLMVEAADLRPGLEVLEPSAGEGSIVKAILDAGCTPDAIEIDPDRADILRDMLPPGAVACMDFLRIPAEPEYDRVLMNPPFGKGAGVQHVLHALRCLKPGGKLVAILGAGLEYRDDGPTRELRELMFAWGGIARELPAGSFRDAGTAVDTLLVIIPKPSSTAPALPAPDHHQEHDTP